MGAHVEKWLATLIVCEAHRNAGVDIDFCKGGLK